MSLAPTPSIPAASTMPILIEPGKALLGILIVILLRLSPDIVAYIQRHWTTVGSISSKIESLHEMSGRIDHLIAYQKCAHPPLSQESQTTLAGLKLSWTETLLLMESQHSKFADSWFLFWRSQEAREDLANACYRIVLLNANIRSVSMEVVNSVGLKIREDESEDE